MSVQIIYFSPTGASAKIAKTVGKGLADILSCESLIHDLTLPAGRSQVINCAADDIAVLALPVYGGRIPLAVDTAVRSIKGNNTPAIILAVYGNRAYDDALVEMYDILSDNGFKIIAAGGFIGEHSYSNKLGGGRPDANDLQTAAEFGKKAAEKMQNSAVSIQVNGSRPYKERHPKASVAPDTNDDCYNCMICVNKCPVAAINSENPHITDPELCIYCMACVKLCPVGAKTAQGEHIEKVRAWLENSFAQRKEIELFL